MILLIFLLLSAGFLAFGLFLYYYTVRYGRPGDLSRLAVGVYFGLIGLISIGSILLIVMVR